MEQESSKLLSRRRVFAGAGTAGALAAAAAVLPLADAPEATATAGAGTQAGEADGRYEATPHVLHYYQTARV